MMAALYKTEKSLKESVGEHLIYQETSAFGQEYPDSGNGKFCVVGPSASHRKWYAEVTVKNFKIHKVT